MDTPPSDPEEWSDEQWQEYLLATADEPGAAGDGAPTDGATVFRKLKASAAGSVVGAGMMGLQQALYGELPSDEVVVEAESDDPLRDGSVFDPDDPSSATLALRPDPGEGSGS